MIITIAGSPGVGKREVGRALASRLGFRFLDVAGLRLSLARERGLLDEDTEHFLTDQEIDEYIEELSATYENLVIASRFAHMFVRDAFKVRIDRSIENARSEEDRERGMRFYGGDPHDPNRFDLALDVSSLDHDRIVELLESMILPLVRRKDA
jgi:Cytidylate kinase